MDEYPDPYEEYDQYGFDQDEYEVMMEQDCPSKIAPIPVSVNRKCLNFDKHNSESNSIEINRTVTKPNNQNCDELHFEELSYGDEEVELNVRTQQPEIVHKTLSTNQTNSKKRNLNELFGDISDIDFEDDIFNKKDKKLKADKSLEYDLSIIKRLSELREAQKINDVMLYKSVAGLRHIDRLEDNISSQIPRWPFLPISNRSDGVRLYIRFHSEQYMQEEIDRIGAKANFRGMMGNSFRSTWEEANTIINTKLTTEETNSNNKDLIEITPIDDNDHLWVDLYKPRNYMELLSDESSNRLLLHWLKLWDKVVFNREPKKTTKPNKPQSTHFQKDTKFHKNELSDKLDEHNRPEYKVVLLCGPPGLGKTTLAHLVARHAGYNVVEINASDDRSVEAFKNALENSTQMKSVLDVERRPNCLVLDEIDGAPANTIDYLIKFVSGIATTKAKKAKKKTNFILKRPIVCICNDLYVPSLRALRQIAFVIAFPPTESARLAERLAEIARLQKVRADIITLIALSEKTHNDIRSCLSVLHFFKSQNKQVTLSDIHKSNIGQKDMQKGLFEIWQQIFQIQRAKLRATDVKSEDKKGNKDVSVSLRSRWVLDAVNSFGEYDKLIQGVFENYPNMRQRDSLMEGVSEGLDWFCFTDEMNHTIYEGQNFILLPYIQYAFVMWHFIFAVGRWQKIVYPNTQYEVNQKIARTRSILTELLRFMQPRIRAFLNPQSLLLDIIPYLNEVIVPDIRPINISLYTPEEKATFKNVVNIMIDYNITYVQEKQQDGSYIYQIEPNIEEIAYLKDINPERVNPYWARQMLAREAEMEKARRAEPEHHHDTNMKQNKENISKVNAGKTGTNNIEKRRLSEEAKAITKSGIAVALPNHLQRLQPKVLQAVGEETVMGRDFFGRKIMKKTSNAQSNYQTVAEGDVWYHFKEGYNNAVRTDIHIDYFL